MPPFDDVLGLIAQPPSAPVVTPTPRLQPTPGINPQAPIPSFPQAVPETRILPPQVPSTGEKVSQGIGALLTLLAGGFAGRKAGGSFGEGLQGAVFGANRRAAMRAQAEAARREQEMVEAEFVQRRNKEINDARLDQQKFEFEQIKFQREQAARDAAADQETNNSLVDLAEEFEEAASNSAALMDKGAFDTMLQVYDTRAQQRYGTRPGEWAQEFVKDFEPKDIPVAAANAVVEGMINSGRKVEELLEFAKLGTKVPTAFGDVDMGRLLRRSTIFLEGPNGDIRAPQVSRDMPDRGSTLTASILEQMERDRGEEFSGPELIAMAGSINGQLTGNAPMSPETKQAIVRDLSTRATTLTRDLNTLSIAVEEADIIMSDDSHSQLARSELVVTSFLKAIDPASTAMGGEVARVIGGQSRLNQLKGFVRRVNQGGALSTKELLGLVNAMKLMQKSVTKAVDRDLAAIANQARDAQIPLDRLPGMLQHARRAGIDPVTGIPLILSEAPDLRQLSPAARELMLRRGGMSD